MENRLSRIIEGVRCYAPSVLRVGAGAMAMGSGVYAGAMAMGSGVYAVNSFENPLIGLASAGLLLVMGVDLCANGLEIGKQDRGIYASIRENRERLAEHD